MASKAVAPAPVEVDTSESQSWKKFSAKEQKLADLRSKLVRFIVLSFFSLFFFFFLLSNNLFLQNAARKNNQSYVVEEDKKKNEPEESENKKRRREWMEQKELEKKILLENGLDPKKEEIVGVPARTAQWLEQKKKQKKEKTTFAWDSKCFC
jgi:hypothetical protein